MLHIVNKSYAQTNSLQSCLRLTKDGHAVLLIEDAVYAATRSGADASGLAAAVTRVKVYALQPDVAARGLKDKVIEGVTLVDYAGFVALVAEQPNCQSWL